MIKKWIFMIVLGLFLVVGSILEFKFIHKSFNWLINSLETLQIQITESKDKIDTEENIVKSYKIHNDWHKNVGILKCLIWHTGIKDVESGLARISVYIQENEYTEAYAEIASLIDSLAHYLDDFKISLENIF